MSNIYELIGCRVREERKALGISIERLAELAMVTPSFLGLIERGKRKLSVETLYKICRAVGVPACELMRAQDKAASPTWECKIKHLLETHPESDLKRVFGLLGCLLKNVIGSGARGKRGMA